MVYSVVTRSHFYTSLYFLLPLFYYLSLPIAVGDLAVWVAHGRHILEHGTVLYKDIYSVLNTKPLIYPVLVSYVYGLIDLIGGLELVSLFHKLILLIILYVIYLNSIKRLSSPYTKMNMLYILLSLVGFSIYFTDRPALVALLPLVISYVVIEENEKFDLKVLLKLAVILVVWVNVHGSWIILPAMLGWKFLFTTDKNNILKNCGVLLIFCLLTLLNPFGYKVWPYLVETATISKLRHIDEWNVTNLFDYFPYAIVFYLTAATFLFLIVNKIKKEKLSAIIGSPVFLLLIMGFTAMRNVGLLSLVFLPFLYKYNFLKDGKLGNQDKKILNLILVLIIGGLCVIQVPYFKKNAKYLPEKKTSLYDMSAPVEFVDYIRNTKKTGPIMNDWEYGSYLLYSLKNPILVDARNIIYHQQDYIEYAKVLEGEDSWIDGVNKYRFEFILLDKKIRQNLIKKIKASDEWELALENANTILFQRK